MVSRWVRALLLLLIIGWAAHSQAAELTLQVESSAVERGGLMRVELASDQIKWPLSQVDLLPLQGDFALHRVGEVRLDSESGVQQRVLWLTPRRSGRLRLPSLELHGLHSEAIEVDVRTAVDEKTGEAIELEFHPDSHPVWPRQQYLFRAEVIASDRYLDLGVEHLAGSDTFRVIEIPQQVEPIERNGRRLFRHTVGWAIFPLKPGTLKLRLPAVHFGHEGVVSHRFYPPELTIEVEGRPAYLPETLPIGELGIMTPDARPWYVETGQLTQLKLTLYARGVPLNWFVRPSLKLSEPGAVERFEPQVVGEQRVNADGVTSYYHYTLPLVFNESGWQQLGPVSLQSIDPSSMTLQGGKGWIELPLALHRWQLALLFVLSAVAIYRLGRWLGHRWLLTAVRFRLYRLALGRLRTSQDAQAIRQVMNDVARAEGWPDNLSLSAWMERWRGRVEFNDLSDWVEAFRPCLYRQASDVQALRDRLIALLRRRLGIFRPLYEFRLNS